jgi:hypothetical protein
MQARHYDPTLGRFIQADTMMLASMTTQGMNRYIYTENDPVNRTDPQGTLAEEIGGAASIVYGIAALALAFVALAAFAGAALALPWLSLVLGFVVFFAAFFGALAAIIDGIASLMGGPQRCQAENVAWWMGIGTFPVGVLSPPKAKWSARLVLYLLEAADGVGDALGIW